MQQIPIQKLQVKILEKLPIPLILVFYQENVKRKLISL
jgi:hypothetical protein